VISDGESLSPARVGIDVPALAGYLDKAVGGLAGPLSVALISGGRSNLTYLATDGHQHWVVRRPPLGHVLATAHDMTREAVVMSALAGTDVPVPEVVACCPDDGVIGAPFCVMRRVDGIVLRTDDDLDDLDRLDLTPAPPARSASTSSTCSPGSTGSIPTPWGWGTSGGRTATSNGRCGDGESSGTRPTRAKLQAWSSWVTGSGRPCPSHRRRRSCMVTTAFGSTSSR